MILRKLFALLTIALSVAAINNTAVADTTDDISNVPAVLETKMALRDLWVEHVFWIRSYVLATAANDENQRDVAETEIVANARQLADTIKPFYGEAAANQLFELLAGHWGAVKSFNTATFDASKSDQEQSVEQLTANAHQIAKFLSDANPFLPEDAVFGLLAAHGAHHVSQINEIKKKDFKAEARTWLSMRKHMFVIADTIAEALAKQFPDRFASTK